jgi:hypothetical protein
VPELDDDEPPPLPLDELPLGLELELDGLEPELELELDGLEAEELGWLAAGGRGAGLLAGFGALDANGFGEALAR